MERRFGNILQGRTQSRAFMTQGMLDNLERMTKRVVGRQIDQKVLAELAKFKLELYLFEGTASAKMATVNSIVLSTPGIKVLSFTKKVDHTDLYPNGGVQSDILTLGVEALEAPFGDDWLDLVMKTRITYNADKVTPNSIYVTVAGIGPHTKVYYEGAQVSESVLSNLLNVTFYEKAVTYPTS